MAVAEDSTTIRVSKETRSWLQTVAESRGGSLGQLVSDLAYGAYRDFAFATEREATRRDELNPAAVAEYELWDEAASDDID